MRQELFAKNIVSADIFEEEVRKKAIATQRLEGITNPTIQEPEPIWQERLERIRDYLTDFYFAYNLPFSRFEEIVRKAVNENRAGQPGEEIQLLTFNPELAPIDMLIAQAKQYTTYPPELYNQVHHHLREINVVLLKSLVSDHLAFIRIARQFINVFDLETIKHKKIGRGKIGGKAAGMLLAYKILSQPDEEDTIELNKYITIPETYYLGSDVYYEFKSLNNLEKFTSQKYLSRETIEREYPRIRQIYITKGKLPEPIIDKLRQLLKQIGNVPIIVRSSSLLEDNFGSAFAGKYDSYFLPNQGSLSENLSALIKAIKLVYVSILSPDALFYRQIQGLDDYDERMAILIQKVQGEQHDGYFFPIIAGVGFSRNPFIWNKKLKREEGFLRIVYGMGTRAVDRVDKDYPRMIGLSHPQLRPVKGAKEVRKYSQRFVDVIDLEQNNFITVPLTTVLSTEVPGIQYLVAIDEGDFIKPMYSLGQAVAPEKMVLTFDNLLKNTDFVLLMKTILTKLERHYGQPVDIEFAVQLLPDYPKPDLKICLLQCRPLSNQEWPQDVVIPSHIPQADQLFSSDHLVPQGIVEKIKYIVYVDPVAYSQEADPNTRLEIARTIGRLNKKLTGERFILMGPGRWGSSNIDLGVKVTYADIYNTLMLVEVAMRRSEGIPEVSYGTHFFQDLVESKIYPLSLYPDKPGMIFNQQFIQDAPNCLTSFLPQEEAQTNYIKLINVPQVSNGKYLRVVMNAEEGMALGYLQSYSGRNKIASPKKVGLGL